MVWPLIAMAAISMAQNNQQQAGAIRAEGNEAMQRGAQNEAIREANAKNFRQTLFKAGLLNVQKAQQTMQLAQQKAEAGQGELQALGSVDVNAAASGTVGASVDAVRSDVQMQFDRVRAQISEENELNAQNFNTQLYDLIQGGQDAILSPVAINKVGKFNKFGNYTAGAMAAGSAYLQSRMDLGLGSKPQAAPYSGTPQQSPAANSGGSFSLR